MTIVSHTTHQDAVDYRLYELAEDIAAGCDLDFDTHGEELEREFAELRLHLRNDA